jgi:tetraacyldisaccharide 4'-kinase
VLLTDFYHLYSEDYLLPAGNLREHRNAAKRADIIIVTKTRKVYSPITKQRLIDSLKPLPHQRLYLSYIKYGNLTPILKEECAHKKPKVVNTIFMFAGIANPYPLEDHLQSQCTELISLTFPDHHRYTAKDINKIKQTWEGIFTRNKLLVTTEKDFMRLKNPDIWDLVVNLPIHYVPIEIDFHDGDKQAFDRQILDYVKKNKRNH